MGREHDRLCNRCGRRGQRKLILYDWSSMPNVDQAVDISNNDGETPLNLAAGKGQAADQNP